FSLPLMLLLSIGAVVWLDRRRDPLPLLPALAWLLLGLWSNPFLFPVRLPYSGYLDTATLATGVWLPLAILAGYTLAWAGRTVLSLSDRSGERVRRAWRAGAGATLGLVVLVGGSAQALLLAPMI